MTYPRRRTPLQPTASQRQKLRERSGGVCEVCGAEQATNWHHRKAKSHGRDHRLSNALHLCGSGTTGCHGLITNTRTEWYDNGWLVRSGGNPAMTPVARRGEWVFLTDDGGIESAGFGDGAA